MTHSTAAGEDRWQRLGALLIQRRTALDPRYHNRTAFSEATGLNYRVVYDVEEARRANFGKSVLAAIEVAYRLEPGAITRFLSGGELEPQAAVPSPPARPPHREMDFGGADSAREALRPYIQEILRSAYEILGVADRFPADDLPDPSEFPDGEAAVSSIPGELLFPDNLGDASTWDKPRLSLRQKLDVIGQGHRLAAQADERERRRTGLTAAAGHIPATGAIPRLVCVAGRAARASS